MRNTNFLLALFIAATGCASPSVPSVDLAVHYDDAWGLIDVSLVAGDDERVVPIEHDLIVQVPDAWLDRKITLTVSGMASGEVLATGTTSFTPRRDTVVRDSVRLSHSSCVNTCSEDARGCGTTGVLSCTQGADSCFAWSEPTPCTTDTACIAGECVPEEVAIPRPSDAANIGNLAMTGLDLTVHDGTTFDTSMHCQGNTSLGACEVKPRSGQSDACICRSDSLTIGNVTLNGDLPLVVLAWRSISVTGQLRVTPGMGDIAMGTWGAGGSYGTRGGGSTALPVWGTANLVPLVGGMGGGNVASGGAGGGALQLVAGRSITVDGSIDVPGAGGGTYSCVYGEGGGSGGALLLESPTVIVHGALTANGGSGGGGGVSGANGSTYCGKPGNDGGVTGPAVGGTYAHVSCDNGSWGGSGGAGSFGDGPGGTSGGSANGYCGGQSYTGRDGGGGGGAGRIRINTDPDAPCDCAGMASPSPSLGFIDYVD